MPPWQWTAFSNVSLITKQAQSSYSIRPSTRLTKSRVISKVIHPGFGENGGQYTHAATWVVVALATLGRGDDAYACWSKLNPILHASDRSSAETYRVEPYVIAADIYAGEGRAGRGGWTWYTGSASWMYRAAVESILGITRRGTLLYIEPVLPSSWPGYEATLRIESQTLNIVVTQSAEKTRVLINGDELEAGQGRPL